MSSCYTVRAAAQRDVHAIASLHVHPLQAAYEEILLADDLQALRPDEMRQSLWREAVAFGEPQVLVAIDGDRPAGFVGFDRSRDPKSKPTSGEISALYMQPGDWDPGAGLALWDAAREGLIEEGCTEVTVWVSLRNARALRCFELAGFKRELPTAHHAARLRQSRGNPAQTQARLTHLPHRGPAS